MPVLQREPTCSATAEPRPRVRQALISEVESLIRLAKDRGITLASSNTASLSKLELMLLDSAFKQLPLEKADKTLLILPEAYEDMLQKIAVILVQMIQGPN